jgi:hypothetical protein
LLPWVGEQQYRNLVLRIFFETPSISRADIARLTGLTRTTVSDIVADLIDEGLVVEIGPGASIGGKLLTLLSLADDARCAIGLDLACDCFCGAIVNLRGQIREQACRQVNSYDGTESLQATYAIIDELVQRSPQPPVGIGVGAPGLVRTKDGLVIDAVNLDRRRMCRWAA